MHVVEFSPVSKLTEQVVPVPKPAINYLPEWWKNKSAFKTKRPEFNEMGRPNPTVKMCVPFRDGMTSGYIQESWQDISIESLGDNLRYSFPTKPEIISLRDDLGVPIDNSFYQEEFVFIPQWIPKVPKGWSVLYTSPINHFELPFWMPSAIVDNDRFTQSNNYSSFPFYIKKDFAGIIPKGTPLYQMIPIKRSSWVSKKNKWNEKKQRKVTHLVDASFWRGYKDNFWTKKEYL